MRRGWWGFLRRRSRDGGFKVGRGGVEREGAGCSFIFWNFGRAFAVCIYCIEVRMFGRAIIEYCLNARLG